MAVGGALNLPLKGFATENSLDEKQTVRWTSDTIQIFPQV
jgi:hypothetical protein